MACQVGDDGRLNDCSVESETPPDVGYGEASLKLARGFVMGPMDRDGVATAGRRVRVPIVWQKP